MKFWTWSKPGTQLDGQETRCGSSTKLNFWLQSVSWTPDTITTAKSLKDPSTSVWSATFVRCSRRHSASRRLSPRSMLARIPFSCKFERTLKILPQAAKFLVLQIHRINVGALRLRMKVFHWKIIKIEVKFPLKPDVTRGFHFCSYNFLDEIYRKLFALLVGFRRYNWEFLTEKFWQEIFVSQSNDHS